LKRLARLFGVLVVVAVVAAGGWWVTGGGLAASPAAASDPETDQASGPTTVPVERQTLTVTEEFGATLGFAGDYDVIGGLSGILTRTVPVGRIVEAGDWLYETDGRNRTSLLYGKRPAWRALAAGVSDGADVLQLEQNLKRLGYSRTGFKTNRHWDAHTTAAVRRWQRDAGLTVDGRIDLGEVVFLPEALRVTEIAAAVGSMAGQGAPVMSGTSTRRVVSLDIDTDDRELFAPDKAVQVELPDGTVIAGTIASIGRIAQTSTDQQGGSSTTLPVTIALDDPTAAGDLDQAAVGLTVVSSSRENVLTVPVNALLALREGGYAVEVVDDPGSAPRPSGSPPAASPIASAAGSTTPTSSTHLVRVEPGLFDHGTVEITADGIQAGDIVVVPS
jgi:peptidoglycan hydrolase-like protein with peptidoglycan-binding domain